MLGNHLLGIYEKALNPEDNWYRRLEKVKELGFDFIEICIDESDDRLARLEWTKEEREELRRASYQTGIPILSMCLSGHRRFPFGSADPVKREKAYWIMEKAIDFAVDLGIRTIQLAGYDVYYEESTFDSRRLFFEGLKWATAQAAWKGVMLANEI
ncbi:MAG TPA: L-ribulose-5-phosphate 3-epimerase, partial [Thermoclostridium caenicola]|uniref:L-ribulose-5-phosphate 3-epimerase n=1 Tax=Thermoclostridium caenicola TaxID=659425 RepID=UPI002D028BE0